MMKIDDYEKYNFNDTLAVVESEMKTHVEAIQYARKGIGQLWTDIENMSEYICYLESLLQLHEIEYHKQVF